MSTTTRSVYKGKKRQLLLSFDVGTTYSGISYCILHPGKVPEIRSVTRFPGHEHISGASKIPTIVYYDRAGAVRAVGAEATREGIYEEAEDGGWVKVEWFKLHLRPKVEDQNKILENIPPLPLNMTAVDILADFLKYLLVCAASFIQETHENGPKVWQSLNEDIKYILPHPNGWEVSQQNKMREAAVKAGLIPNTPVGRDRLSFVTEGKANLHFAVHNGLPPDAVKNGAGVVIVDAGKGAIDVSSYIRTVDGRIKKFAKVGVNINYLEGSSFVSLRAGSFFEDFLCDSRFVDDIDHIVRCFDKTTKLRFRSDKEPQHVKFGSTRDNDDSYNIRFGQLKLDGTRVAQFFQPSIDCVVQAVMTQQRAAQEQLSYAVLVGGFSASDWLFNRVHSRLSLVNVQVIRPENHVNKAVSDGAISFYLDNLVQTYIPANGPLCGAEPGTSQSSNSTADPVGSENARDMEEFLDKCQPPQGQYHTILVGAGWTNMDYLRNASGWPDARILDYFRSLPTGVIPHADQYVLLDAIKKL